MLWHGHIAEANQIGSYSLCVPVNPSQDREKEGDIDHLQPQRTCTKLPPNLYNNRLEVFMRNRVV